MGHSATVARNAVWLITQGLLTGLASIVVAGLVARYLGTESYGILLLMLSYHYLFTPLTVLGTRPYSVREIARDRGRALAVVQEMLALRLVLASLAIAVAAAYILLAQPQISEGLLTVLSLLLLFSGLATCFIDGLYGTESFKSVAKVMGASGLIVQAGCVVAIVLDAGLLGVASAYVIGAAISLGAAGFSFSRQVGPLRFPRPRLAHFTHVHGSWTYFFQNIVLTVRHRIDVVLINNFLGAHAAGLYGSSHALVQRIDLLQDGATTALFPRVTDLHARSPEDLKVLVRGAFKLLLVLSTPMAAGLFGVSSDVVELIFGSQFLESAPVLAILALGIPFSFTYGLLFNVLTAMGLQRTVFYCSVGSSIASVAFLVGALTTAGIAGAAVAYVFSLASSAIPLVVVYLRRMGPMISTRDAIGLAAANAIMGGVLWLIRDLPLAATIPISAVVFAVAVRSLGIVTLEMVRSALRRPNQAE